MCKVDGEAQEVPNFPHLSAVSKKVPPLRHSHQQAIATSGHGGFKCQNIPQMPSSNFQQAINKKGGGTQPARSTVAAMKDWGDVQHKALHISTRQAPLHGPSHRRPEQHGFGKGSSVDPFYKIHSLIQFGFDTLAINFPERLER